MTDSFSLQTNGGSPRKIALGTVQFGLDYGISNESGRIPVDEIDRILRLAFESGIRLLDTAAAYGDSETVIGAALERQSDLEFEIITKASQGVNLETLRTGFQESLGRLSCESVRGYLLHDFNDVREKPELMGCLSELKAEGIVHQIGVSLYFPWQAQELLDSGMDFDLVQVPYNLFDRRFESVFPELLARGVEVHARSAFLQGLFLMEPDKLSGHFDSVKPKLRELRSLAERTQMPTAALALCFACARPEVDRVVIGVGDIGDLRENLGFEEYQIRVQDLKGELSVFSSDDEKIILPYNWK